MYPTRWQLPYFRYKISCNDTLFVPTLVSVYLTIKCDSRIYIRPVPSVKLTFSKKKQQNIWDCILYKMSKLLWHVSFFWFIHYVRNKINTLAKGKSYHHSRSNSYLFGCASGSQMRLASSLCFWIVCTVYTTRYKNGILISVIINKWTYLILLKSLHSSVASKYNLWIII